MAIEIPSNELFKVQVALEVRWSDLDALGHVNNARYFGYFEQGRIGYLERVAPGRKLVESGVAPLLAHTECDFLAPIEHPASLLVGTRALRVGSSSVELQQTVRGREGGRVHAIGRAVLVFFDLAAGAAVAIPQPLREAVRLLDGV
ncbi:MAG TPA: acyl-CoA thioesterase [Myxococcales bacterium]|jgi:acyl-CoA thioester hydrolase|nr:acyl-CoA thioesterase [Myxococcales bacterium]